MAIDKMIPRFLVSDEDERLLKEGAMTDALNVSISEDGDGSEGVVKNMKGTIAGTAIAGSELTASNDVTVIGQVSDPQRGYIYFFVADAVDSPNGSENSIYRYDTSNNQYKTVFKSGYLDFSTDSFVKADVVNGAFQQDGITQTILYFTDNDKAPRKINVDRAIAGDYNDLSFSDLDYALNSIKAAPVVPLGFSFTTDATLSLNNFRTTSFQLAYQYIYTDGEESALSSYSRLAFPDSMSVIGIDSSTGSISSSNFYEDNVCDIQIPWVNIPDVSKVRISFREGNTGAFRVLDEFDPNSNLSRSILGTSTVVYNHQTSVYKFYNDGAYRALDAPTVNKLYDNVPLKAEGQAIAGNRLMYSNYSEGRANGDDSGNDILADITVEYSLERDGGVNSSGNAGITETGSENPNIALDFGTLFTGTIVPAGSVTNYSFEWDPEGFIGKSTNGSVEVQAVGQSGGTYDGGQFKIKFGSADPITGQDIDKIPYHQTSGGWTVSLSISNDVDLTFTEFADFVLESLNEVTFTKTYDVSYTDMRGEIFDSQGMGGSYTNGSPWSLNGGNYSLTVSWKIDPSDATLSGDTLTLVPKVTFAFIGGISGSQDNGQINILTQTYNGVGYYDFSDTTSTPSKPYLTLAIFSSTANHSLSSFKAGSTHEIGVVYYDKYNRSGNVNRIGSAYVAPFGDPARTFDGVSHNGPASIKVTWPQGNTRVQPPSWAEKYQFVYPGMGTFDSFVSYTAGGAYYNVGDDQDRRIYVSLNTLDAFATEKSSLLNYSYTEGDKLRVISRDGNSGDYSANALNVVYPRAIDGSVIEFDVVGVEVITESVNKLHSGAANQVPSEDPHIGTFLVLESPAIHSSVQVDVSGLPDSIKYEGFDWYSISNTSYPDGDASSGYNYWGQRCVFELLTPSKVDKEVYYEIGSCHRIGTSRSDGSILNKHGSAKYLSQGDVHYKPTSCKTPWRDPNNSNNWNEEHPHEWRYETIYTESQSVNDFFASKDWNKGRPHAVFENSAEVRRRNGITYGDAYAEDVANLSLSSFNPSLGNFDSLESKFGAINYIGNYNDNLVALQENKLSLIPVGKNIIQYAEGSGNVAISTNVLGQARYSSGDYGCGGHPEAVLIQDNDVFFVDESRQAVMRLGGEQLAPISEKNMSSFFEDFFTNSHTRYVSGYDPRISTYFITGLGGTAETVGYDVARGVWQSKYSFMPDVYANQNNMLYSAKYVGTDAFWRHDDDSTPNRNTFHGTAYPSEVEMVSKISPSRVKVYNALSYEGDSAEWDMNPGAETDLGQTSGTITSWKFLENSYYADMPRNTSAGSYGSNIEYIYVGNWTCPSGDNINFLVTDLSRPDRLPFIFSGNLTLKTFLDIEKSINITSVTPTTNGYSVVLDSAVNGIAGNSFVKITDTLSKSTEDVMRGHYAKIKLTNSSKAKHELYCINTHITDSKSHHPLGQ